ncbi:MAG: GAF domain-containing protein, partial [Hyphomicrobiales bacterium]
VDYSNDERFTKAIAKKTWFGPVYFRRGSEPYMTISLAHVGGKAGATIAEVNLKLIWDVVTQIKVGEAGYAFIVDEHGRLVAHPDMSLVLRETDLSRLPQVASALAEPNPGALANTAETTAALDGSSVLSAYARIPRLNWIVFVQLPTREALAPVYASLAQTGALLGLGLLLASVMGGLLARRMVVPIRRLQQGAEKLGEGELGLRIDIRTGDEIETLADRFNLMASRIQESHETLEAKVDERTRDLGEALQQQTATADVLKVISRSAFDLDTVLTTLIRTGIQLCSATRGVIWLRAGEQLVLTAHVGYSDEWVALAQSNPITPAADAVTTSGLAAFTGEIVHVQDIPSDPRFSSLAAHKLGDYRAGLAVPLKREGRVEGVIALSRPTPILFTDRQIALVQTFADQAVIAIENVRLFEEVQAKTRDLGEALQQQTATADVLKVISRSAFDLKTVLTTLTESARSLCGAAFGVVFLREGDILRVQAESGANTAIIDFLRAHPIKAGRETFTGRVFMTGEVSHLPDVLADPEYNFGAAPQIGEFRAALAVPLKRDGRVEGVFSLAKPEPGPFTPRQIELVKSFADQAVIAIENARLFEEVQARTKELTQSLGDLRSAQDRLIQSEKLASLGQLTAGIAHEIKNPLNFVNNFAALSGELIEELHALLEPAALDDKTRDEVDELTQMLKGNLEKVVQHGKRADSIVKNMLLHSRESSGEHRPVDLNAVVEESVNLAYHGARAEKPGFNITLVKNLDPAVGEVDLYPQEFTRVLLNLISNGFYAATKRKAQSDGQADGKTFEPTLTASTRNLGSKVEIKIRDNGTGIPAEVKAKMFNPFFTTKPAGEGTGLGLSLSHDIIVKQHGGTIGVDTEPGEFTEFTITLPRGAEAGTATGSPQ